MKDELQLGEEASKRPQGKLEAFLKIVESIPDGCELKRENGVLNRTYPQFEKDFRSEALLMDVASLARLSTFCLTVYGGGKTEEYHFDFEGLLGKIKSIDPENATEQFRGIVRSVKDEHERIEGRITDHESFANFCEDQDIIGAYLSHLRGKALPSPISTIQEQAAMIRKKREKGFRSDTVLRLGL